MPGGRHVPVMIDEVLESLEPRDRETYVDGTFGDGGYSEAILNAADCKVLGIDRDPVAVERGRAIAAKYNGRLAVVRGRFGDLDCHSRPARSPARSMASCSISAFRPISSTMPSAGSRSASTVRSTCAWAPKGQSAADIVNALDEAALADIIYRYGEERKSRRIARAIIAHRRETPIRRTLELADIVSKAIGPHKPGQHAIHPATRTFQALRIYVNDELRGAGKRPLAPPSARSRPKAGSSW